MIAYDTIGVTYTATRQPDPRVGALIAAALGDARSVINVGAGAGSYEPPQTVLAVEPSPVMISQRPAGAAAAVQARAEALPVAAAAADAAMALLTVHHWADLAAGIAELRRVARRRIVIFSWDQRVTREFWLVREYLPEAAAFDDARTPAVERLADLLGGARIEPVLIPMTAATGSASRTGGGPGPTWIRWCARACRSWRSRATRPWRRDCGGSRRTWRPARGTTATVTC